MSYSLSEGNKLNINWNLSHFYEIIYMIARNQKYWIVIIYKIIYE